MNAAIRALLLLALPVALFAQPAPKDSFPHVRHAKLFPTCAGCHAGIVAGDASRTFPSVSSCANCHDGTIEERVTWTPPGPRGAGLIAYSHTTHASAAKDATCIACHAADTTAWMQVARAAPESCGSCHAHAAPSHLDAASKCTTCHRTLSEATALTDSRVAALPRPPSHSLPTFISGHGSAASTPEAASAGCATCHARESCARCHVNAVRSPAIQALPRDARVARTVAGRAPSYPTPATHLGAEFAVTHAPSARAASANCATCHSRSSCETCHTGTTAADVIRRLPDDQEAAARGVRLRHVAPRPQTAQMTAPPRPVPAAVRVAPPISVAAWTPQPHARDTVTRRVRVHAAGFARSHGTSAASGELNCSGCHAQSYCSDCHTGERTVRTYHRANFVATHAPQAYGRETDCSACHSTQAFCRSCHIQSGLAPRSLSARTTTFHNAQPYWLLNHGRAARQDLASCSTCHQQTYCMQCHSNLGARINPHGAGFDGARMSSRNSEACLLCHLTKPPGK